MPAPLPSTVPPGLWSIVQRCLAKEPAQRYQQASEVQAALEAVESASRRARSRRASLRNHDDRDPRHAPPPGRQGRRAAARRHDEGRVSAAFDTAGDREWDVAGPYFHGHAVYAMAYDGRDGRHRLWASTRTSGERFSVRATTSAGAGRIRSKRT